MKILVWHDKHSTHYFDASTPEAVEAAALEILDVRLDAGYLYDPGEWEMPYGVSEADVEVASLTDEEIDALPKAIRVSTKANRDALKKRIDDSRKEHDAEVRRYKAAVSLVAGEVPEMQTKRYVRDENGHCLTEKYFNEERGEERERYVVEKQPVTAWWLVDERSGYEYERVEIETVMQFGESDETL